MNIEHRTPNIERRIATNEISNPPILEKVSTDQWMIQIEIEIGIAIEIETIGHLNTISLMSYVSR